MGGISSRDTHTFMKALYLIPFKTNKLEHLNPQMNSQGVSPPRRR